MMDDQEEARDQARALLAHKFLWQLLAAAESQVDVLTWRNEGGFEAQDFLDAIGTGRPHPLLRLWEERKAGPAANRPAPGLREKQARHLVRLMCVALQRAGHDKQTARKFAAARLAAARPRPFPDPPSAETIKHWQRNAPPLTPGDENIIAAAFARHGVRDHKEIAERFIGLIHFNFNPLAQFRRAGR